MTTRFAPLRRLNVWLYRRGVRQALLRNVLRFQITICLATLVTGLGLWSTAAWIFWIGAGTALSVWNFFSLTKLVPQFMVAKYTSVMGVAFFLRSQGRLLGSAAALTAACVWAEAPAWALFAGFSMSLAGIVWSVSISRAGAASSRRHTRSPI